MHESGDIPPAQDNPFGRNPGSSADSAQGSVHDLTAAGIEAYLAAHMDGLGEERRLHVTAQALALMEYYSSGRLALVNTLCGWLFLLCQRDGNPTVDPRLVHEAAFRCDLLGNPGGRGEVIPFPQGQEAAAFLVLEHRIHGDGKPEPIEPVSGDMDAEDLGERPQDPRWPEVEQGAPVHEAAPVTGPDPSGGAQASDTPVAGPVPGAVQTVAQQRVGLDPDPIRSVGQWIARLRRALSGGRGGDPRWPVWDWSAVRDGIRSKSSALAGTMKGCAKGLGHPARGRAIARAMAVVLVFLLGGVSLSMLIAVGDQGPSGQPDPAPDAGSAQGPRLSAAPVPPQGLQSQVEVGGLLTLAKAQYAEKKLTTPPGDNALETYTVVLRLRPGPGPALNGLRQIRDRYRHWAETVARRGEEGKAAHYRAKAAELEAAYRRQLTADGNTLTWAGCGVTKKAFMVELAAAFEKQTGIRVLLEGGGATRGIRDTAKGVVHFGGACRMALPLANPLEMHVALHPVAWDALAVILHRSNPVDQLSAAQLKGIYRGEIRNWKALGGPDAPIHLYVRQGKISGVGYAIRQYIFQDRSVDFVTDKDYVVASSGPLEQAVENDPHAISITGVSSARRREVKVVGIDGHVPSYENLRDGRYLFYRPLYLVTEPSPSGQVQAFLDFAQSEQGRRIIRENGTVPYADALQLAAKTLIHGFGVQ
jgi:phosphate transport system substrate-binding protein